MLTTLFTLFLILVAWFIALGSVLFDVSQATRGVAGICFACFMIITARVLQADAHHRQLMAGLAVLFDRSAPQPLKDAPRKPPTNPEDARKFYGVSEKGGA